MKKLFIALLTGSTLLVAQSDPLFIKNVTFKPNGCTAATSNITVTGAGGSPTANGYTFTLVNASTSAVIQTITGKSATFENVSGNPLKNITIQDSKTTVTYKINSLPASQTGSISFNIDSLPLGDQPGCITCSVTNPAGPTIAFQAGVSRITKTQAPFSQTFSSFAQAELRVIVGIAGSPAGTCDRDISFSLSFPFPQGEGNNLNKFLYKKLCSCALQSSTVPVAV